MRTKRNLPAERAMQSNLKQYDINFLCSISSVNQRWDDVVLTLYNDVNKNLPAERAVQSRTTKHRRATFFIVSVVVDDVVSANCWSLCRLDAGGWLLYA